MKTREILGFYLSGLFNNSSYVIMIAGAKSIAPSMVGLIYVCNVVPSFIVKLSGPYWFHFIPYKLRIIIACILMALSFILVAIGGSINSLALQLFGVVLGSVQSGFGEASFLALTAFYDSRLAVTAWSSGTGFAGIFGYGWVIVFSKGIGASFTLTLLCALVLPVLFLVNYSVNMNVPSMKRERPESVEKSCMDGMQSTLAMPMDVTSTSTGVVEHSEVDDDLAKSTQADNPLHSAHVAIKTDVEQTGGSSTPYPKKSGAELPDGDGDLSVAAAVMTVRERLANTLSLWPFMVPLFLVYFAEYAMQSGVWAAMGFPVTSENARDDFYQYSNWMYQAGVLVSRSSGTVWQADMTALWVMPLLQCGLLLFFILDAYYKLWYDWSILTLCFVVGLFGGAVYVNGFSLIAEKVPPHLKEFSLSAASIADSVGIALSNVAGIFIQRALYKYHDISD